MLDALTQRSFVEKGYRGLEISWKDPASKESISAYLFDEPRFSAAKTLLDSYDFLVLKGDHIPSDFKVLKDGINIAQSTRPVRSDSQYQPDYLPWHKDGSSKGNITGIFLLHQNLDLPYDPKADFTGLCRQDEVFRCIEKGLDAVIQFAEKKYEGSVNGWKAGLPDSAFATMDSVHLRGFEKTDLAHYEKTVAVAASQYKQELTAMGQTEQEIKKFMDHLRVLSFSNTTEIGKAFLEEFLYKASAYRHEWTPGSTLVFHNNGSLFHARIPKEIGYKGSVITRTIIKQ